MIRVAQGGLHEALGELRDMQYELSLSLDRVQSTNFEWDVLIPRR